MQENVYLCAVFILGKLCKNNLTNILKILATLI